MKTAVTRLRNRAGAIALMFLASACYGPSPTDPIDLKIPTPAVASASADKVVER